MESLARQVESVPKSLNPSSSSSTDASKSMCVICLSGVKKEEGKAIFTGECSHSFHFGCITKNIEEGSRICPICRFQWTQVPANDVIMLERINWLVKKEHELKKETHELVKRVCVLQKKQRDIENELEKRVQIIDELKKEIHELKEKKKQDQDVEAGEEDIGHKDSDHGIEAKSGMKGAREHEGGSKKMKKTMVRSSIMTRQKTRELN